MPWWTWLIVALAVGVIGYQLWCWFYTQGPAAGYTKVEAKEKRDEVEAKKEAALDDIRRKQFELDREVDEWIRTKS